MKPLNPCFPAVALLVLVAGCASDPNHVGITNRSQPGPKVGQAIGAGVGAVGGNIAGGVVGVGEGAVAAASVPFDNKVRVIRRWKTVETADGRSVQVPEDIQVDENGVPIRK